MTIQKQELDYAKWLIENYLDQLYPALHNLLYQLKYKTTLINDYLKIWEGDVLKVGEKIILLGFHWPPSYKLITWYVDNIHTTIQFEVTASLQQKRSPKEALAKKLFLL